MARNAVRRWARLSGIVFFVMTWLAASTAQQVQAAPSPTTAPDAGLKVAILGDQALGANAQAVLNLVKNEGTHLVIHNGDFDYTDNPAAWDNQITSILGADFPYFASVGNHDLGRWSTAGGYQQKLAERLARVSGASCTGDLGVKSVCTYRGLWFLLSGAGTLGTGHDSYIREQCGAANHLWKIVGWHKNQAAMQIGGEPDEVGWGPYEEARRCGAIITTGHHHSYSRTRTLVNTQTQTVDAACGSATAVCVDPGRTFAVVSGLGGHSVRQQTRCLPATAPYGCKQEWASISSATQGGTHGAMFLTFGADGDPAKASGYFKNINGQTVDSFTITTGTSAAPASADQVPAGTITVDGSLSEGAWRQSTTDLPYEVTKVLSGTWNNTARYSALWSTDYLYVGARVTDTILKNDSVNMWDDDSVDVYLDPDHSHGTVYDTKDNQFSKGWNDAGLFVRQGTGPGVLHGWKAVSGGYEVELAIPWTLLGITPSAGATLGFDITANDDDNGGARDGQAAAFGTVNNWKDTSGLGHLTLRGNPAPLVGMGAITVDGSLAEGSWRHAQADLPYAFNRVVSGAWNNTARYSALWSADYLYVGVRVTDAALRNDSSGVHDDDSIDVYVDGNHTHGGYDAADNQYQKGWNDPPVKAKNGDTTGVLHAWRAVTGGYEIELAIPWASLGVTPAQGLSIGFDLANNDDDNGAARDGQAMAFGTSNNWQDTTGFGHLTLGPELPAAPSATTLAFIADTPYGDTQEAQFPALVTAIDSDPAVSAVLHAGDIKQGGATCDDARYNRILSLFQSFGDPFVLTPGDNDWTDCHRASAGSYVPTERLARVRQIFYPVPGQTLGGNPMTVATQAGDPSHSSYVENIRFTVSGVTVSTVHVVGSNNDLVPWDGLPGGDQPSVRMAEFDARMAANLAWVDAAFDEAAANNAPGVLLLMQTPAWNTSGFTPIRQKIIDRSAAFGKPVLLAHGDKHVYEVEPGYAGVANLTRLGAPGATATQWLRLVIDPATPAVFSWTLKNV